jgi:hypothetical protein
MRLTDSYQPKEFKMKMHVLTAAVLAALASGTALAASEGGDTWSELRSSGLVTSAQSSVVANAASGSVQPSTQPSVSDASTQAASEGGDTWSAVQPSPLVAASDTPLLVATTASLSTLRTQQQPSVYGTLVEDTSADRTVRIGPHSHWVNVGYGDTVRFVVDDSSGAERSFMWKFDVSPEVSEVDLDKVAPADFLHHQVQVFVTPNPLYSGG